MGVIGHNGAGKSTLLKILSGITIPTSGEAFVHGSFSSLLEVGTGFHPDLTGRENIFLNAGIIGIPRRQVVQKLEEIIAFSGVARYVDEPLRTYSSGMRLRLAFAVMAHLTTDILALDEVLAVGDTDFQLKCMERIFAMRTEGCSILFVSHNLAAVRQLCDRVIVLNAGTLVFDGVAEEAIRFYTEMAATHLNGGSIFHFLKSTDSHCTEKDAQLNLHFSQIPESDPVDVGINIMDRDGNALLHFSNRFISKELRPENGELRCQLKFEHGLKPGEYPFHVFLGQHERQLEWAEHAGTLSIPPYNPHGFHNPDSIQAAVIRPFSMTTA